jgi:hypothetical protein
MKNKSILWFGSAMAVVAACFISFSCNKKFDEPPTIPTVDVVANTTIAQLKSLHSAGGIEEVTDSAIISGIVVADDSSGNFYKQIVIEDSTGGIMLYLDGYDLYTTYPIGTQIFVKAQGLYLGDDNGWVELGGGIGQSHAGTPEVAELASSLFNQYIEAGTRGNYVAPHVVTVSQLTTSVQDPYQSTLIQLNNFEFASTDTGKTYATAGGTSSIGFNIVDCSGDNITLYNSDYALFAGITVPGGNGTITGIYVPYESTKQIEIRDTADVQFTGTRCNGGGGGGGGTGLTSIANIISLYSGTSLLLGNYTIGGTVISDVSNGNISKGSVVIEDGSNAGIEVYFGSTITYNVGDSIILNLAGDSLTEYKGSYEISAYGATQPVAVATGRTVVPQIVTISELNAALSSYEFSLVQILNATATSTSGNYSGSQTLTDATGSMEIYTSSGATFATTTMPTGAHNWTGYASFYNTTPQFQIRNTSDVQ